MLRPSFCMPLAPWEKEFPAPESNAAKNMLLQTKLLHVWERQWPQELRQCALAWAQHRRSEKTESVDWQRSLRGKLDEAFPALIQAVGEPYAFRTFGDALAISASAAVRELLSEAAPPALPLLAGAIVAFAVAWEGLASEPTTAAASTQSVVPQRARACGSFDRSRLATVYDIDRRRLEEVLARLTAAVARGGADLL